jgi:hypothetical protein
MSKATSTTDPSKEYDESVNGGPEKSFGDTEVKGEGGEGDEGEESDEYEEIIDDEVCIQGNITKI